VEKKFPAYQPIAVVGIGCRFPGEANSPQAFWELLCEGRDAIGAVPADRWNQAYFYADDRAQAGALISPQGGFLKNIDAFDAGFFGISPTEAAYMDPQQRLLLQVSWEALEQGGIAADRWAGRSVGVFTGCFTADYWMMQFLDPLELGAYSASGMTNNMLANRISHAFDFRGPSLALDTACSASLTAVHQACMSLQSGESEMALAGGVMLMLLPDMHIAETKTGFLSRDARCQAFSANANGYVRSEGCGIVVLKRLEDALAQGDNIQGIIAGSAINQDGRTLGITLPNGAAQTAVMRRAMQAAAVQAEQVCLVEAHGTGTSAGDPIEAEAISRAYRSDNQADALWVGACKSNIGHTESAAGIAGLIKALLCLQHRSLPPNLHAAQSNPFIPFESLRLALPQTTTPLPSKGILYAGVNSFGYGGSNAHIILQSWEPPRTRPAVSEESALFLPLSAQSERSLRQLARAHATALSTCDNPQQWCAASATQRASLQYRKVLLATDRKTLIRRLCEFADGQTAMPAYTQATRKQLWIFGGLGQVRFNMSRQLLRQEAAFRTAYEACDRIYQEIAGFSVLEQMNQGADDATISDFGLAAPALFFHQAAALACWKHWGIQPDAVLGHSSGTFAAFYAAGVFPLKACLEMLYQRVVLLEKHAPPGGMMSVHATQEILEAYFKKHPELDLRIGAYNSPNFNTITGDNAALEQIAAFFQENKITHKLLDLYHPYHHEGLLDPALFSAATIKESAQKPTIPLFSSTLGGLLPESGPEPDYWIKNLCAPVLFRQTIEAVFKQQHYQVMEISGHLSLLPHVQASAGARKILMLNAFTEQSLRPTLANCYEAGWTPRWDAIFPPAPRLPLPAYPWKQETHWHEPEVSRLRRLRPFDSPLLGYRLDKNSYTWEQLIAPRKMPWLSDHKIMGECILPGAVSLEMALTALSLAFPGSNIALEQIKFEQALRFTPNGAFLLRMELLPELQQFRLWASRQIRQPQFERLVSGNWRFMPPGHTPETLLPFPADSRPEQHSAAALYANFETKKFQYGPAFQAIQSVQVAEKQALAHIELPEGPQLTPCSIHPVLLDNAFQAMLALPGFRQFELPMGIESLRLYHTPGNKILAQVQIRSQSDTGTIADISLFDPDGRVLGKISGFQTKKIQSGNKSDQAAFQADNAILEKHWTALAPPAPAKLEGRHFLLHANAAQSDVLSSMLKAQNAIVHTLAAPLEADFDNYCANLCSQLSHLPEDLVFLHSTLANDTAEHTLWPIMALARAIGAGAFHGKLHLLTACAQAFENEVPDPIQAAAWGMARVFRQEYPDYWAGAIDICNRESDIEILPDLLGMAEAEDQLLLRHKQVFALRLRPFKPATTVPVRLEPRGSYIVTGALGALGRLVAEWLVQKGARSLLLTSSRPVPASENWAAMPDYQWLHQLQQQGVSIQLTRLDLSDEHAVSTWLEQQEAEAIRGLMYCAGIVADELLENLMPDSLNRVLHTKLAGARAFSEGLKRHPVEHFVLFSSVASVLPNRGMGSYAAANAALDALAAGRRAEGLPAISLNWGPWAAGMIKVRQMEGLFKQMGIHAFSPEAGMEALNAVFFADVPQLVLQQTNWPQYFQLQRNENPVLRILFESFGKQETSVTPADSNDLEQDLRTALAELLNCPPDQIDSSATLAQHGLESIAALILSDLLLARWQVNISSEDLLGDMKIEHLIGKLSLHKQLTV
jgi:acyl transferase domain-containing protein